ncbi:MAG: hypothetical protein GXP27_03985, partial [Planctomycetes bacterium]|nr:hypothetical protein [Planctomycetota bacterium]
MTIRYTPTTETEPSPRTTSGLAGLRGVRKAAPIFFVLAAAFSFFLAGCNQPAPGADEGGDFAPGAFPPTLSDVEYHQKAWSRATCLSC